MKTTVEISDPLLRAARGVAQSAGTTLRELIERGLELAIAERRLRGAYRMKDASVAGRGIAPHLQDISPSQFRDLAYQDRDE